MLILCVRSPVLPWLELKSFEREVKRNVDPVALQQWAINLLADHAWDSRYDHQLSGTNMPAGLSGVEAFGSKARIYLEGSPANCIRIWRITPPKTDYGSYLVVGGPSLPSPASWFKGETQIDQWKPGIYFVGEPLDWR